MYLNLVILYFCTAFVSSENLNNRKACKVTSSPKTERASPHSSRLLQRIHGGEKTTIEHVPYMAAILEGEKFVCGGSILKVQWVVSAAQCLEKIKDLSQVKIRIKSADYRRQGQEVNVDSTYKHTQYNKSTHAYDVSLFKVNPPFTKSGPYRELELSKATPMKGHQLTISGWGETERGKRKRKVLRWANVTVLDNNDCITAYRREKKLYPSTDFCAGNEAEGKDACDGDVGSPAVKDGSTLVGIVSIAGCGESLLGQSAYTDVYKVSEWITETIIKNNF